MRVFGSAPNSTGHAAKHLRSRLELDVNLKADGGKKIHLWWSFRTKDTKVHKGYDGDQGEESLRALCSVVSLVREIYCRFVA